MAGSIGRIVLLLSARSTTAEEAGDARKRNAGIWWSLELAATYKRRRFIERIGGSMLLLVSDAGVSLDAPNNSLHWTAPHVTPFAVAKVAPRVRGQ